MNIKREKIKLVFIVSLTIVIAISAVITASNLDTKYYLLLLTTLPFIFLSFKRHQRLNTLKTIADLRKNWGVPESRIRNIPEIHTHFTQTEGIAKKTQILDDRTWNDLDMDLVYAKLDRTLSIPGEISLYSLLRHPITSVEELDKRECVINLFSKDQEIREEYQVKLSQLGKNEEAYHLEGLWENQPSRNRFVFLYRIMLFFIPVFIVVGILSYSFAWFGLVAIILFNMFIHYRTKEKIYEHLSSIRYLGKLIRWQKNSLKSDIRC